MKWIKRSNKREWLQRSPSLSTVSGEFCLWNTTVWVPKEEFGETPPQKLSFKDCKPKKQLDFKAELIFSIRSHYAIIHANDFIGKVDSLKDYINKLNVVKNTIKEFLKNVQEKTLGDKSYTVKRFLNSDSGFLRSTPLQLLYLVLLLLNTFLRLALVRINVDSSKRKNLNLSSA